MKIKRKFYSLLNISNEYACPVTRQRNSKNFNCAGEALVNTKGRGQEG